MIASVNIEAIMLDLLEALWKCIEFIANLIEAFDLFSDIYEAFRKRLERRRHRAAPLDSFNPARTSAR